MRGCLIAVLSVLACTLPSLASDEHFLSLEQRLVELFSDKQSAVVQVFAAVDRPTGKDKNLLFVGSGFFISKEGHILTSSSIAYGADRTWIEFEQSPYAAEILGHDLTTNLSLLKLTSLPKDFQYIHLSEPSSLPAIGSFAVAITRQVGLPPGPSLGLINGHNISFGQRALPTVYLRADIPSQSGESGSPVFNLRGELIGVLAAALPEINSSFILPTRAVKRVRDDIVFSGKVRYAWFGMQARQIADLSHGRRVVLEKVIPDSPAAQTGLKAGDVLLKIGDYAIETDRDLRELSFYTTPEAVLTVRVKREEEELEFTMRVTERPPPPKPSLPEKVEEEQIEQPAGKVANRPVSDAADLPPKEEAKSGPEPTAEAKDEAEEPSPENSKDEAAKAADTEPAPEAVPEPEPKLLKPEQIEKTEEDG